MKKKKKEPLVSVPSHLLHIKCFFHHRLYEMQIRCLIVFLSPSYGY